MFGCERWLPWALSVIVSGCCGDLVLNPDGGLFDGSTADAGGNNNGPPTLGPQVDRSGRAASAILLVAPFDLGSQDGAREMYNSASIDSWPAAVPALRQSLALFDSFNGVCGDQYLADSGQSGPERYDRLANLFADDRLYVNTAFGTCRFYLAVELAANGEPVAANDCGGRTPGSDVIDLSYSLFSTGRTTGVTDGVPMDTVAHPIDRFPFLAAP